MELKFSKYHGCGNDFIIINEDSKLNYQELAIQLCNRVISVGADGLIVVKTDPLEMLFFNADGSRGTMCGNGIRCFCKYIIDNQLSNDDMIDVLTLAGTYRIEVLGDDLFKVNMGKPDFSTKTLKLNSNLPNFINQRLHGVEVSAVFTGTVHVVVFVKNLEETISSDLGKLISNDPIFYDRSNVNFVQVIDQSNFLVRTYERGVGWTYACGTGATATYAIGRLFNYCDSFVNIHFPYGTLQIKENENKELYMIGKAVKIAKGIVYL